MLVLGAGLEGGVAVTFGDACGCVEGWIYGDGEIAFGGTDVVVERLYRGGGMNGWGMKVVCAGREDVTAGAIYDKRGDCCCAGLMVSA